jgi:hypothetical protein
MDLRISHWTQRAAPAITTILFSYQRMVIRKSWSKFEIPHLDTMENPETYAEKLIRLTPTMDGAWMATIFLIWNFDLSELFYNCCDL